MTHPLRRSYHNTQQYLSLVLDTNNEPPLTSITVISCPYKIARRDIGVGRRPIALLEAGFIDKIKALGLTINLYSLKDIAHWDDVDGLFKVLRRISLAVKDAVVEKSFPIILAGDCSTTVGVQAGIAATVGKVPSCVWFDAHDNFKTPDDVLASPCLDSMAVAMMAGLCWKTLLSTIPGFRALDLNHSFVHYGMRNVTDLERSRVEEAGFPVIWGDVEKHVDFEGELSKVLDKKKYGETMVHLDLDALDWTIGKVNRFTAPGGLLEDDLVKCLKTIPSKTKPVSLTITSYEPFCDDKRLIPPIAIKGAVAFVQSLVSRGFLKSSGEVVKTDNTK
ncbi:hypothetical protein IL306_014616 [Fusarium sp. DS 682]|nr:hypothetical protein IL306_014616 [Fusarium sp. DS 682]